MFSSLFQTHGNNDKDIKLKTQNELSWFDFAKQASKGFAVLTAGSLLGYAGYSVLRNLGTSRNWPTFDESPLTLANNALAEANANLINDLPTPNWALNDSLVDDNATFYTEDFIDFGKNIRRRTAAQPWCDAVNAVPPEILVNTFTTNNQDASLIRWLPNGNYVVVWKSNDSTSVYNIRCRIFASNGQPLTGEIAVTSNSYAQDSAKIAILTDGSFIVGYSITNANSRLMYQRFSQDGFALGNVVQIAQSSQGNYGYGTLGIASGPSSSLLANYDYIYPEPGNFFYTKIRWGKYISGSVQQQGDVSVATPSSSQYNPDAASLDNSGFVFAWEGAANGMDLDGIHARFYSNTSIAVGAQIQINSFAAGLQSMMRVRQIPGGCIFTWTSAGQDGSGNGVYFRRYRNNGSPIDAADVLANTYTSGNQQNSDVAAQPDGSFYITWDGQGTASELTEIYLQKFAADGSKIGNQIRLNSVLTGTQQYPSLDISPTGILTATWQSNGSPSVNYDIWQTQIPTKSVAILNITNVPPYTENVIWNNNGAIALLPIPAAPTSLTLMFQLGDPAAGTLSMAAGATGTTVTFNATSGILTLQSNNQANAQLFVSKLRFTPTAYYNNDVIISTFTRTEDNLDCTDQFVISGIPVNQAPILNANNMMVFSDNLPKTVTSNNLQATDIDNAASGLVFNIINLQNGRFVDTTTGLDTASFSQNKITFGEIQFAATGPNPTYKVSVFDGQITTLPATVLMNYDIIPKITRSSFTVRAENDVLLTSDMIAANDADDPPSSLIFSVSQVNNGFFAYAGQTTAISQFSMSEILSKKIVFTSNSQLAPDFLIAVSDGKYTTQWQAGSITFLSDSVNTKKATRDEASLKIGLSVTGALISAAGTILVWRYKNHKDAERLRNKNPIANIVRKEANISGIADFESSKEGRRFCDFIQLILEKLRAPSIDIESRQMEDTEQAILASAIATALKPHLQNEVPTAMIERENDNKLTYTYRNFYYGKYKPYRKPDAKWLEMNKIVHHLDEIVSTTQSEYLKLARNLHTTPEGGHSKGTKNIPMHELNV